MPLAPPGARFRADPALFNTPNSTHRVPTNQVLVPPTSQHGGYTTRVSSLEMDMLLAANRAISDTWQVLNKGSGNQEKHLRSTGGDAFKRTALVHERRDHLGNDWAGIGRVAARFQAGNCAEMAAVCALLGASSPLNQPVSVMYSPELDHTVAEFGDRRATNNTVIADPWPEFGRAMRKADFFLIDRHPAVLQTLQPYDYQPLERKRLLYDNKVSQERVDYEFGKLYPAYPKGGEALVNTILNEQPVYSQEHSAKHLGMQYEAYDSQRNTRRADLNLTQYEFKQRLVQLGLHPVTGQPTPGNRRPPTSAP